MVSLQGMGGQIPKEKLDLKTAREQWRKAFVRGTLNLQGTKVTKKAAQEAYRNHTARGAPAEQALLEATRWAFRKGLTNVPMLLMNGELLTLTLTLGRF